MPLSVRVMAAVSAVASLRLRSTASRTSPVSPDCTRASSETEIEVFGSESCVVASSRMRTFCGRESNAVTSVSQRESPGSQLLDCRSEAIQTSAVPASFSMSQSSAACSMAGMSAAVSVGWVPGSSAREATETVSGLRVALSIRMR